MWGPCGLHDLTIVQLAELGKGGPDACGLLTRGECLPRIVFHGGPRHGLRLIEEQWKTAAFRNAATSPSKPYQKYVERASLRWYIVNRFNSFRMCIPRVPGSWSLCSATYSEWTQTCTCTGGRDEDDGWDRLVRDTALHFAPMEYAHTRCYCISPGADSTSGRACKNT